MDKDKFKLLLCSQQSKHCVTVSTRETFQILGVANQCSHSNGVFVAALPSLQSGASYGR